MKNIRQEIVIYVYKFSFLSLNRIIIQIVNQIQIHL